MSYNNPERDTRSKIDIDSTFLPIGKMRQISRVTDLSRTMIAGEIDLGPDHWVYPTHFPEDPIFPGSLLIEGAGQLVALWAWAQGQRGRPRMVRITAEFRHPVEPNSVRLRLQAAMRSRRKVFIGEVHIWAEELHVATAEAVITILPAR